MDEEKAKEGKLQKMEWRWYKEDWQYLPQPTNLSIQQSWSSGKFPRFTSMSQNCRQPSRKGETFCNNSQDTSNLFIPLLIIISRSRMVNMCNWCAIFRSEKSALIWKSSNFISLVTSVAMCIRCCQLKHFHVCVFIARQITLFIKWFSRIEEAEWRKIFWKCIELDAWSLLPASIFSVQFCCHKHLLIVNVPGKWNFHGFLAQNQIKLQRIEINIFEFPSNFVLDLTKLTHSSKPRSVNCERIL